MAAINLGESLWKEFVAIAKKNREKPERLAERVLREYVARAADEGLLARSEKAARRAGVGVSRAEAAIKESRR